MPKKAVREGSIINALKSIHNLSNKDPVMKEDVTLALIVGTRGIFNPKLAVEGRKSICARMKELGCKVIVPPQDATPNGAVETVEDARVYTKFLQENREKINGIVITLPNFGDELGTITALKMADLKVPVLVHAFDDEINKVDVSQRRDSFCGKLSVCNNLHQYGIPFTDTTFHTEPVESKEFAADIDRFVRICRIVGGLRTARIAAIGARPTPFQTMRYSEKLLQAAGITVVTLDLSEILFPAMRLDDHAAAVTRKLKEIRAYGSIPKSIADEKVLKQAKFSVAAEEWIEKNDIHAAAFQCWTSIQQNYGCAACLTMSMLGEKGIPCACEVDVGGVLAMYILRLATGNASALLDWNNNYGADREKCVCTHCSNYPKSFIDGPVEISNLGVLGTTLGPENCFGGVKGKVKAGPMTFLRADTDDLHGKMRAYLGEGEFTDDRCDMDGGIAVCKVKNLQGLMKHICKKGFEHHVAMVRTHCAGVVREAIETYLGWELYAHE